MFLAQPSWRRNAITYQENQAGEQVTIRKDKVAYVTTVVVPPCFEDPIFECQVRGGQRFDFTQQVNRNGVRRFRILGMEDVEQEFFLTNFTFTETNEVSFTLTPVRPGTELMIDSGTAGNTNPQGIADPPVPTQANPVAGPPSMLVWLSSSRNARSLIGIETQRHLRT